MDVTSDKAVDPKTGIITRNKHGLTGVKDREWLEKHGCNFTYVDNVELYRRQLWRGVLRQGHKYPHYQKPSKQRFNEKLMKYAARAGFAYIDYFSADVLQEKDLLIGWAGKKLKDQMREKGRVHFGRKYRPVRRTVLKSVIHHMSLANRLTHFKFIPAEPLEPWTVHDLNQIIDCQNGNKGQLQFIDSKMNTIRTIAYVRDESLDESAIIPLWSNISVPRSRPDAQGRVRPLFRRPGFPRRAREIISESTIESMPPAPPTYLTSTPEKKDEQ